ncbi:hypothetical protein JOB18_034018 [Solea senegalensis]|uniref:Uncharacterized protein n=1 Tax=Solea senegalensis TaxID=28829 RepID=A0AAV6RUJ5_SOLSE|nr:hypothetical protein JOB18_034018 [Solea senegalensis]
MLNRYWICACIQLCGERGFNHPPSSSIDDSRSIALCPQRNHHFHPGRDSLHLTALAVNDTLTCDSMQMQQPGNLSTPQSDSSTAAMLWLKCDYRRLIACRSHTCRCRDISPQHNRGGVVG